jgi:hypothetical protein
MRVRRGGGGASLNTSYSSEQHAITYLKLSSHPPLIYIACPNTQMTAAPLPTDNCQFTDALPMFKAQSHWPAILVACTVFITFCKFSV